MTGFVVLLLVQLLPQPSACPPKAFCNPGTAFDFGTRNIDPPAIPLLKNASGVLWPDQVTITQAKVNVYVTATDAGDAATYGNVLWAVLFVDGKPEVTVGDGKTPLARTTQLVYQPRTIDKGKPFPVFVRVLDGEYRYADSKVVVVTRK